MSRTWLVVAALVIALVVMATACGDGMFKHPSALCETLSSVEEDTMTATSEVTDERILEVRDKYRSLFQRQPNYHGNGPGRLIDKNGEMTEVKGITVVVYEKVEQNTLPVEDRIPDCLEGVPVQIVEEGPNVLLSDPLKTPTKEEPNGRD